jgi:hypothetical protein
MQPQKSSLNKWLQMFNFNIFFSALKKCYYLDLSIISNTKY